MLSIKRITINNFRQYKDLNLTFNDEKGLYLFIGKNGMGKSNFLNAICWCLYEKQPFRFHHEEKKTLNEETEKENKFAEVLVKIEVEMDNEIYIFQRTQRETQDASFIVMRKYGEDWKLLPNPKTIVDNFLPESVMQFFLFDGEAVQNLYKGDYSEKLKKGVWKVSNVFILDRASEHLENTLKEIRKSVSRDDPSTDEYESQLSQFENKKVELEENINKDNLELSKIKLNKQDLEAQLLLDKRSRDLQQQRNIYKDNVDDAQERLKEYQRQLNDLTIEIMPFWYIKENLVNATMKINEATMKGKLPPNIKGTFITELLDRKKCICGSNIEENTDGYRHLHDLLQEVDPLDRRTYLLEDKVNLNLLLKEIDTDLFEKMKKIREQKAKERREIDEYQLKLNEISLILTTETSEQIGDLELTIKRMDDEISNLNQNIGALKGKLLEVNKSIEDVKVKLDKSNKNKFNRRNDLAKVDFLENGKEMIDYVKNRLIDQVRQNVSFYTNKYFKDIIWKKDEFESVKFTNDYEVEVLKKGQAASSLKNLSTGEMKVLSFATIKALGTLSGFSNVPIFIDGPLENLDKEVKTNFLNSLPNFITDKQVFIFSLDGELIETFGKENVSKNNYYKLIRENDKLSTTIKLMNI